jgi:hypothetical protein
MLDDVKHEPKKLKEKTTNKLWLWTGCDNFCEKQHIYQIQALMQTK